MLVRPRDIDHAQTGRPHTRTQDAAPQPWFAGPWGDTAALATAAGELELEGEGYLVVDPGPAASGRTYTRPSMVKAPPPATLHIKH